MDSSKFTQYSDFYGYRVYYENYEDVRDGIGYLMYDCESSEAKVFFDAAYTNGRADFQDAWKRNFTLFSEGGYYYLTKR